MKPIIRITFTNGSLIKSNSTAFQGSINLQTLLRTRKTFPRFGRVSLESVRITSYGAVDEQQLRSLESWLEVALENSARSEDGSKMI